jgi:hypothetical protein
LNKQSLLSYSNGATLAPHLLYREEQVATIYTSTQQYVIER